MTGPAPGPAPVAAPAIYGEPAMPADPDGEQPGSDPRAQAEPVRVGGDGDVPIVGVVYAIDDGLVMARAETELRVQEVPFEVHILGPGDDVATVAAYARDARPRGLRAIVCSVTGGSRLAHDLSLHSHLPVVGVPLAGATLGGLDALLSCAHGPHGVPVACVGVDAARDGALLAARIVSA